MLTPLDVKRQQFTKQKFGGYDPEQVHGFLERVATELEAEKDKQRALESRAAELEKKIEHYERVELALQEALETARETARVAQEAAEKRARVVLDEAELRAQEIVRDAETERHSLRQDLSRITSRQKEVAAKMRAFLLSELELLAKFEGDDPVGFLKLETSSGEARQLHLRSGDEVADEESASEKEETSGLFEGEEPTADEPNGEDDQPVATHGVRRPEKEEGEAGDVGDEVEGQENDSEDVEQPVASEAASPSESGSVTTPTEEPIAPAPPELDNDDAEIDWNAVTDVAARDASGDERESDTVADVDGAKDESEAPTDSGVAHQDDVEIELPPVAQDDGGETGKSKTWNLSKLIRGEEGGAESDAERERIRRILEDLD